MRLLLALIASSVPVLTFAEGAEHPRRAELLTFMGGHGCTLSPDSVDAAEAAGMPRGAIQDITQSALENGEASEQGAYIVFSESACQIRLPDIVSKYTAEDAVIRAGAPYVRETFQDGDITAIDEGCFVEDAVLLFAELEDFDPRAGFEAFLAFTAAGLIAGDVRFYETSPLKTPKGFQVISGAECGSAPNVEQINANHSFLLDGFADYVRFVGARTECGDAIAYEVGPYVAELQGYDHSLDVDDQAAINAWLDFEFLFITMAAGWHEGMTDVDAGTPRPPLCHYPD